MGFLETSDKYKRYHGWVLRQPVVINISPYKDSICPPINPRANDGDPR